MATAKAKTKPDPLSEGALLARLELRYPRPEWAFFAQVRDAAGFGASRTLDGLAMNTWPSRGLEIHGFECKSSRNDWQRELADPSKAEAFARFCDRWWVVAGADDIVREGELPPTWGLLVPRGVGLTAIVEAPQLAPAHLTKSQIAVLLRRAAEPPPEDPEHGNERARQVTAAREKGILEGERRVKERLGCAEREVKVLRKALEEFEEKSGLSVAGWNAGNLGEAVSFVMSGGMKHEQGRLEAALLQIDRAAEALRSAIAATATAEEGKAGT